MFLSILNLCLKSGKQLLSLFGASSIFVWRRILQLRRSGNSFYSVFFIFRPRNVFFLPLPSAAYFEFNFSRQCCWKVNTTTCLAKYSYTTLLITKFCIRFAKLNQIELCLCGFYCFCIQWCCLSSLGFRVICVFDSA